MTATRDPVTWSGWRPTWRLVAADAAAGKKVLPGPSAPRRRRLGHGAWKAWSGAAAALLVLAWGIGSLGGGVE